MVCLQSKKVQFLQFLHLLVRDDIISKLAHKLNFALTKLKSNLELRKLNSNLQFIADVLSQLSEKSSQLDSCQIYSTKVLTVFSSTTRKTESFQSENFHNSCSGNLAAISLTTSLTAVKLDSCTIWQLSANACYKIWSIFRFFLSWLINYSTPTQFHRPTKPFCFLHIAFTTPGHVIN